MTTGDRATRLGELIRRQRELGELSMRQFADVVGISNPYLSQIERGLREPSERVVDAIAAALDVTTDRLYEQAGVDMEAEEEPDSAVEDAIRADTKLTGRQRQALLEVYRAFAAQAPAPRGRRRADAAPEAGSS